MSLVITLKPGETVLINGELHVTFKRHRALGLKLIFDGDKDKYVIKRKTPTLEPSGAV